MDKQIINIFKKILFYKALYKNKLKLIALAAKVLIDLYKRIVYSKFFIIWTLEANLVGTFIKYAGWMHNLKDIFFIFSNYLLLEKDF